MCTAIPRISEAPECQGRGGGERVEGEEKNIPLQSQPWPKTFGLPSAYFLGQESGRRRTKWRPAGSLPQDGDKA